MKKSGVSDEDLEHCIKVAQKAVEIAKRTTAEVDIELIARGALLHDLGKSKTHGIEHGRIGAELGKELGLPSTITDIMEKHIRGGLTEDEAKELGLPVKDYSLKTIEEKIVIYADRLVDIITEGIIELKDERGSETRFEEIIKQNIKYGKNDITTRRYMEYHKEIQSLMKT
ncbi:metal dependent phosphohydrolase [Candidatus Omnitrophus magneticus]|uniref:Metal dependent phosphohydrolase n=1 Tax=Candidatus Omnitrophus magneticus TaxID=1609969 RepID=A0A0F0CJZ5_9BACT|nr:metal dependent phosphohydrolase [Candidatus Omnitrophus magneticus]